MWHIKKTSGLTLNHKKVFFKLCALEHRWELKFIIDQINYQYFPLNPSYLENSQCYSFPIHMKGGWHHQLCLLHFLESHYTGWYTRRLYNPSATIQAVQRAFMPVYSFSQMFCRAHPVPGSVLGTGVTQRRTRKIKVVGAQTVSASFYDFTEF